MATRFLAGALIGLVAGLMLAPKPGEELRNDLSESADKLQKRLKRMARRTAGEVDDLRDLLEDEVTGLADDVRFRLLTILDEAQEGAQNVRNSLKSELR